MPARAFSAGWSFRSQRSLRVESYLATLNRASTQSAGPHSHNKARTFPDESRFLTTDTTDGTDKNEMPESKRASRSFCLNPPFLCVLSVPSVKSVVHFFSYRDPARAAFSRPGQTTPRRDGCRQTPDIQDEYRRAAIRPRRMRTPPRIAGQAQPDDPSVNPVNPVHPVKTLRAFRRGRRAGHTNRLDRCRRIRKRGRRRTGFTRFTG